MPFYYEIDETLPEERRTARRLVELRAKLDAKLPERNIYESLLLATWNIREFDSTKFGKRSKEAIYYIAEIVSRFDLVAVQEVREDLKALEKLTETLGKWWKYIVTDVTEGSAGNRERMAFLYDSRKVRFSGVAGEIVIPAKRSGGKLIQPDRQLARTPFMVGFEVGWFRFMLCTVHIYYGEGKAEDPKRVEEIRWLAEFLAERSREDEAWSNNMILLGDFNIFRPKDITFKAITDAGFVVPEKLQKLPSNALKDKHYDQIAIIGDEKDIVTENYAAGVFDYFDIVYTDDDEGTYVDEMGAGYNVNSNGEPRDEKQKRRHYRAWRTHQMSDHLPMWIELKVDLGPKYLARKMQPPD